MISRALNSSAASAISAGTRLAVLTVMTPVFHSHLDCAGPGPGGACDLQTLNRDLDVTIDGVTVPMSAAPDFGGSSARVLGAGGR
jgi:hypothetical protein